MLFYLYKILICKVLFLYLINVLKNPAFFIMSSALCDDSALGNMTNAKIKCPAIQMVAPNECRISI